MIALGISRPAKSFFYALVCSVGSVLGGAIGYLVGYLFFESVGSYLIELYGVQEAFNKVVAQYQENAFWVVAIAGFTPIPFFPFRFLVVMTGYPVWKYLLAVFLARTPRFYLLAFFGQMVPVPTGLLTALFVGMLAVVNIPALIKLLTSGRESKTPG